MYNRIIQFNDFKIFRNEKEVVILDIENGKLVKVDERTLKVIQNNNLSKEELFQSKRLNFRHGYKNPRPHFCNRSTLIIHI